MSDFQQQVEDAGMTAIEAAAEALAPLLEPGGNEHVAKVAVEASWEIIAKPWAQRVYTAERYRSVAGDLWNLAHEAIGALGAWDEDAQDWRFDQIEDDGNRLTAIRLSQAIEDYDKLAARDRIEAPS